MNFISVKQSCPTGDLLSMLPGLKQLSKKANKKIIIYQRIGMVGQGMHGANHPFEENGFPICMNEKMFEMVKPLIMAQSWVEDFLIYEGQQFKFDLDIIRSERHTTMPNGSINRWLFYCFPQMVTDLSKKWIELPETDYIPKSTGKILINRTERYFNNYTTYFFLKTYESNLLFTGLPNEHERFCKEWKLNIPLLQIKDFLELAYEINACKFFIGNQSMAFQIAEGLKVKRILEVFEKMPNVIPQGENGYDFLHQDALENYVNELFA